MPFREKVEFDEREVDEEIGCATAFQLGEELGSMGCHPRNEGLRGPTSDQAITDKAFDIDDEQIVIDVPEKIRRSRVGVVVTDPNTLRHSRVGPLCQLRVGVCLQYSGLL